MFKEVVLSMLTPLFLYCYINLIVRLGTSVSIVGIIKNVVRRCKFYLTQ